VAYITTDNLLRPGSSNVGLSYQNLGAGSLTLAVTYDDPKLATNPVSQAGVTWSPTKTIASGDVAPSDGSFPTALKVVFASAQGSIGIVCM